MTFGLKFYFRKIYIHGKEHIPSEEPVIFACNHPSSFMEAVLMACFQPRTLHFLVRGDVFKIKWLKGMLHATNQIPIFRFRDGFSNMKQNLGTFSKAYDVLAQNGAIIIYPEGSTIWTKELRPLQKGVAKLALGAIDERELKHLKIIPVGVNYFNVFNWRSEVSIQIGQPIMVRDFLKEYNEHPNKGYVALTQAVYKGMQPLVLSIPNYTKNFDPFLTNALRTEGHQNSNWWFDNQFKWINSTSEDEFDIIRQQNITQLSIDEHMYWARMTNKYSILWIILLALPALLGALVVQPIRILAEKIIKGNKMDIEFIAPVKVAIFLVFNVLFVLTGILLLLISPWKIFSIGMILSPLWAKIYAVWKSKFHDWNGGRSGDILKEKMLNNINLLR